MRFQALSLAVLASIFVITGCATVTRGSKQKFRVETTPPGARVDLTNGQSCAATPCDFKLKRKSEFTVNISKLGCEPASVFVSHELSGKGAVGMAGNVVVGGVVGVGIDAVTGATQDLHPNPVQVALVCEPSATNPAMETPKQAPKQMKAL